MIKAKIRVYNHDLPDEDGTVIRSAQVTTRAAADKWIKNNLAFVETNLFAVGEATEYAFDPEDGWWPVAYGITHPGEDFLQWG